MSAHPSVRWGWHRLRNAEAARLVARAEVCSRDLVLDVGAGDGAITRALVRAGARVVAFELHAQRATKLRAEFAGEPVTVVRADVTNMRLPRRPFKVVANPPFATSTAVLRRLVAPKSELARAVVVVPWHVARRWAAGDVPGYSRWSTTFDVRVGRGPSRSAFEPPPPNDVSLLIIERRRW